MRIKAFFFTIIFTTIPMVTLATEEAKSKINKTGNEVVDLLLTAIRWMLLVKGLYGMAQKANEKNRHEAIEVGLTFLVIWAIVLILPGAFRMLDEMIRG